MLTQRKFLFGTTVLAGVLTLAAPAFAQSAQSGQDEQATEVEEVVVTGSRIRRDPTNAPTPLIQVSREALLSTGQSTVIDYLATIPALSNSIVPSDTTGGNLNDGGLSLPNLRSLGSNRTLTLVDGRRHVGSSAGSLSVDVDAIPRLLIQNIEIVTGGASSVYGADAVSGVLNFILRDDFEGLEVDANYGQINQNGEASKRFSALIGQNFFDDRLNVYAHGEFEQIDEVRTLDLDWLARGDVVIGLDADPAATPYDGNIDNVLFSGVVRLDRPRWGSTTLANSQQPSPLNDPDVAFASCTALTSANCYSVDPARTYWFDGTTARLANFGQRLGNVGANRVFNIGGDGENPANFGQVSRSPESESQRFQVGTTFHITDNITAFAEYKYITEDTFDISQPTFFSVYLNDETRTAGQNNLLRGTSAFDLRYSDNAFLPANLRQAIATNMVTGYSAPTATAAGTPLAPVLRQWAEHRMFGPDRTQTNNREINRFVVGLKGDLDRFAFVKDINWEIAYVNGELQNVNNEAGVDSQRFALAADAVVDTTGVLGTRGAVVCRSRLLAAQNVASGQLADYQRGGDLRDTQYGRDSIAQCTPLNIFGVGNQSAAALAYVEASINVRETNEQEQTTAFVSGQIGDFWGAGDIGIALGLERRREYTEGIGRSADTAGRLLFMNTGPDFPGAEYESDEAFAELSIPLFRDSYLGDFAELSASYRYSDYTTVGETEVYGVNLVYRPIPDIAFKTSFNTSVRVPNLAENFRPASQTFFNAVNDPCATAAILGQTDNQIRSNRIANCTALAAQQGRTYDFAGATPTNVDDFVPVYGSGVAGVNAGNPFLQPEESESFTFSTVLEPSFIPNLTLVLDYYEIELSQVIAAVGAQAAANNCVNGASLNTAACATIFRRDPTPGREFYIGAPAGDPIGGFIQGSINYAALSTRGLDFTARYSFDFDEMIGRNWGRLDYSVGGLWLIEQEQFLNSNDPSDGTELGSGLEYPRVRLTSSMTYAPNDIVSFNWSVDWQTSQDIIERRNFINNPDNRDIAFIESGNFARHDFTVRWNVRDDLSVRAGVVNAFDAEPSPWVGPGFSNFDQFGQRFFIGLNYRPF
ncbi:MAG: TonB-dependent receptor [Brevundimonas sp.]|uniref:TonB-dependent receptor domain-containing protein n=1 Tax=Brevundimonas sp. TaxID=1871086 RepID=UPI0027371A60|nr:TonB-dependent receptor [Brevundimonas sp.]MDP3406618.1 TonB-dependent receptor [Brevundimonas sp.]